MKVRGSIKSKTLRKYFIRDNKSHSSLKILLKKRRHTYGVLARTLTESLVFRILKTFYNLGLLKIQCLKMLLQPSG